MWLLLIVLVLLNPVHGHNVARFNIPTARFDNTRSGYNMNEIIISPSKFQRDLYGKIFERSVNGHVYSQPLYMFDIEMSGGIKRNALYVATMDNRVAAFDPDNPIEEKPLWERKLGEPVSMETLANECDTDVREYDSICMDWLGGDATIGILSTPTIDLQSRIMYVVTMNKDSEDNIAHYVHSLDIRTGESVREPVLVEAYSGSREFQSRNHIQRANLILHRQTLFVAFGGYCLSHEHHGWVMAFDTHEDMQLTGVWCTTPRTSGGSILRQDAITIDERGQMIVVTGIGGYDGVRDFADSIVVLDSTNMEVRMHSRLRTDVRSPNFHILNTAGSATPAPESDMIFSVDGQGWLSLLSKDDLSVVHRQKLGERIDEIVTFRVNYDSFYVWPANSGLLHLRLNAEEGRFEIVGQSSVKLPSREILGGLCLTGDDEVPESGIMWATRSHTVNGRQIGVLHAFSANDVSQELWNSELNQERDRINGFVCSVPPLEVGATAYIPMRMPDKTTRIAAYSDLRPRVVKLPVTYAVVDPDIVSNFSIVATGLPPLRYQWYYEIRGGSAEPIKGATEPQYSTVLSHSGMIYCRVSNMMGHIDSYKATVIVRDMGPGDGDVTPPPPKGGDDDDDDDDDDDNMTSGSSNLDGSVILGIIVLVAATVGLVFVCMFFLVCLGTGIGSAASSSTEIDGRRGVDMSNTGDFADGDKGRGHFHHPIRLARKFDIAP